MRHVAFALLAAAPCWAQAGPKGGAKPPAKVDQARVDRAIASGVGALKSAVLAGRMNADGGEGERSLGPDELVLWTFVHAGVGENDPVYRKLFDAMLKAPLEATYRVSLQAMILEEVERVRYQARIHQCAQFLVDNQNPGGRWPYGSPSPFADRLTPSVAPPPAPTPARRNSRPAPGPKAKPAVVRRIEVKQMRTANGGDNSNSQYAALGIRACHDAGIVFPKEVLERAERWWRESQKGDPGQTASGRGWCYGKHDDHRPYGSMTAGGVGSLAIYDYIRDPGESWKNDKDVRDGLAWLARNFSVAWNPGPHEDDRKGAENTPIHYYYFLYALERAGMLCGTERIGTHEWYPEGVKVLLDAQKPTGEWGDGVIDTCFAVLFLGRATRPLHDVASVDRISPKK
jgi:hypothetical protein